MKSNNSRRKFLQQIGTASLLMPLSSIAGHGYEKIEKHIIPYDKTTSSNETIRIACIGMGIMGFGDVKTQYRVLLLQF